MTASPSASRTSKVDERPASPEARRSPSPALFSALCLAVFCLAAGVACNEADRDSRTEPVLLPEDLGADAVTGGSSSQEIYQGYTSETNPVPPETVEDAERFLRTE